MQDRSKPNAKPTHSNHLALLPLEGNWIKLTINCRTLVRHEINIHKHFTCHICLQCIGIYTIHPQSWCQECELFSNWWGYEFVNRKWGNWRRNSQGPWSEMPWLWFVWWEWEVSSSLLWQSAFVLQVCWCNSDFFLSYSGNRILGGIPLILPWWPIKPYRPCPNFIARGGNYSRIGQPLDEIAFGRGSANIDEDDDYWFPATI